MKNERESTSSNSKVIGNKNYKPIAAPINQKISPLKMKIITKSNSSQHPISKPKEASNKIILTNAEQKHNPLRKTILSRYALNQGPPFSRRYSIRAI